MDFKTLYETHAANAQIAASGSQTFFIDNTNKQNKDKHGSFNYLEIVNDSNEDIKFQLDGLSTRERKLFGKSSVVIKADEDIHFDTLKLINTSGANVITADSLKIVARIMKPVLTPVILSKNGGI